MEIKNESRGPAAFLSKTIRIPMMDCAAEEAEVRRALENVEGIASMSFQLGSRTLTLRATDASFSKAIDAIRLAGFAAELSAENASSSAGKSANNETSIFRSQLVRLVLALAFASGAEALAYFGGDMPAAKYGGMLVAAAAIALAGLETYRKGLRAIRYGKLNITALMSVAVTGAFIIGQWPEAAMVMALYGIAELIEARSLDRARNVAPFPRSCT